jgi:hypothetical protein
MYDETVKTFLEAGFSLKTFDDLGRLPQNQLPGR